LQVLSRHSGVVGSSTDGPPVKSGEEEGGWINADPIDGCVVVNIGESERVNEIPW
jgi:isopenicillin N synthase-like dioxygenase